MYCTIFQIFAGMIFSRLNGVLNSDFRPFRFQLRKIRLFNMTLDLDFRVM